MPYVVGDSYGGLQGAAAQQQSMQADSYWKMIAANRAAAQAQQENYWKQQAMEEQMRQQHSQELMHAAQLQHQRDVLDQTGKHQDALEQFNQDQLDVMRENRDYKKTEKDKSDLDNRFNGIYGEIWNGHIKDTPTLMSMGQEIPGGDKWDALMTALGNAQKSRVNEYMNGAAKQADELSGQITVPETLNLRRAEAQKKYEDAWNWGNKYIGPTNEPEKAAVAALDAQIQQEKAKSAAAILKGNRAAAGQLYYDPASGRFHPMKPAPQDTDAAWYVTDATPDNPMPRQNELEGPPAPPAPAPVTSAIQPTREQTVTGTNAPAAVTPGVTNSVTASPVTGTNAPAGNSFSNILSGVLDPNQPGYGRDPGMAALKGATSTQVAPVTIPATREAAQPQGTIQQANQTALEQKLRVVLDDLKRGLISPQEAQARKDLYIKAQAAMDMVHSRFGPRDPL